MNDANIEEEQPCTSSKEIGKTDQGPANEVDKRVDDGIKLLRPATEAKESKLPEKKRKIQSGRIEKLTLRRLTKRPMKRRTLKHRSIKRKHRSMSTIASRRSSQTTSAVNIECQYCGHRCCRRRYEGARREAFKKRREIRKLKNGVKKKTLQRRGSQHMYKKLQQSILKSESVQAGSRSLMLSSLCEKTNVSPSQDVEQPQHCEVTPEMIYESMRRLTMWKQDVATMAVLEYVKRNYPVCQDIPALFEELALKLQVAAIVGFVVHTPAGRWRLCTDFQKRHLPANHATLFWITYVDTMKPVTKKIMLPIPVLEKDEKHTNTKSDEGIIKQDCNDVV